MLVLYKPVGFTPLQAIEKLKEKNEFKNKKLSYAGRLDPMAEGLLLVLIDGENKKRRDFEKVEKTYEFEVVFGIYSDSYDVLGIPSLSINKTFEMNRLEEFIEKNKGKIIQKYPPYSAVRVNGRPLYYWTRKNVKVEIPERESYIFEFKKLNDYKISKNKLSEIVFSRLEIVQGDFRQVEINNAWKELINKLDDEYLVYKFKVKCSSGTYVRSIVEEMGNFLGTRAMALSIKRTQIGVFNLSNIVSI